MKTKISIRFLTRIIALGILVILYLGFKEIPNIPYYSSPVRERAQDRARYEQLTDSGSTKILTMPSLGDVGDPPELVQKISADSEFPLNYSFIDYLPDLDAYAEVFEADFSHEVVLPTGVRLKLTGMALTLPEDAPGIEKTGNAFVGTPTRWLDPVTFESKRKDFWLPEHERTWGVPTLHLSVRSEGGPPVRWLMPEIFDRKTLARASGKRAYWTSGDGGSFMFALDCWHSANLDVSILVAYGEPEIRDLTLKLNEQVEFGTDALVKVVADIPADLELGTWGEGISEIGERKFQFDYRPRRLEKRSSRAKIPKEFGLFVWPKPFIHTTTYQSPGMDIPRGLFYSSIGGYSAIAVDLADWEKGEPSITLTRRPKFARVVFRIPKLPRLPDSSNLFSTPIRKVVIDHPSSFSRIIGRATFSEYSMHKLNRDFHSDDFPMTFENTTPFKLLREFESLTSTPVYYDKRQMTLTTLPPISVLERAKVVVTGWWKSFFP